MKRNSKGQYVLKYSISIRIVAAICFALVVCIFTYLMLTQTSRDSLSEMAALIIISFCLGLNLNFNLTWFAYDDVAIERHRPFKKTVRLKWTDVQTVRKISYGLKIEGMNGKIYLSGDLKGLQELGQEMRKQISAEKWEVESDYLF